jgi:hypothetical protein
MTELSSDVVTNDFTGSKLPQKTGDPSIDFSPPTTTIVTVDQLDVTRFPQGSMVATHQLRLPSHAPYLDDAAAQGNSTEDALTSVTQEGVLTPSGHFHSDVKAKFEGDPYVPVDNVGTDVVEPEVVEVPVQEVPAQPNTFGVTTPIVVN